jgi:hypothetical protein
MSEQVGAAPGLPIRHERAAGYWLQVPGECEERISASIAPEHLRGTCQPGSMSHGALLPAGAGYI